MNKEMYLRPAQQHRTEIVVVNSRFITTIERATSTRDARDFISEIRTEMPDASHHVYAFRVGYGHSIIEGMSDNGEPSGTAGPPTLAVLRGTDFGDLVLVTTRYFGGTKLGTGGLVRAYSEAAKTALSTLKTELKAPKVQIGADVSYSQYEPVKLLVRNYKGQIEDEIFAGDVTLIIILLEQHLQAFKTDLTKVTSGQVELVFLQTLED